MGYNRLQTKSQHAANSITNLKMLISYIHSPTF